MGWSGPLTGRQYVLWLAWLEAEWNTPDRGDHYSMQNAALLKLLYHAVLNKTPPSDIALNKFKIPFVRQKDKGKGLTREQAAAFAKARWKGLVEGVTKRKPPGEPGVSK